ncbi:MAG: tRNA pseudouridine(55) synthase TruB [Candidatus Falkowbacteria bacterium]
MDNLNKKSGFILIDKPFGRSSHSIVWQLRRITQIKKIGHAGTLDPRATGLLILAIGREATKQISQFVKMDKEYVAEVFLGKTTSTYDSEGEITNEYQGEKIKRRAIRIALKKFKGEQLQVPPMFSAKKVNGKKLYELARKDIEIERLPSKITIYKIKILKYSWPKLSLRIYCSSGTYIRSIAYDLGQELGCGAYLSALRRTKIAKFKVSRAKKIDKVNEKNWQKYLFFK